MQGLYGAMRAWHEAQGLTWGGLRCKGWQGRGEGGLFTGGKGGCFGRSWLSGQLWLGNGLGLIGKGVSLKDWIVMDCREIRCSAGGKGVRGYNSLLTGG